MDGTVLALLLIIQQRAVTTATVSMQIIVHVTPVTMITLMLVMPGIASAYLKDLLLLAMGMERV